jgi:hypothetical protein
VPTRKPPLLPPARAGARAEPLPPKEHIRSVAVMSLLAVAADVQAPPAARAAASRTLLESLGDIGRLQEVSRAAEKPLNEMNARELDAEIARMGARMRK